VRGWRSPSVHGVPRLVSPRRAGGSEAEGVLVDVPQEAETAACTASPRP
jgi:hypothetical protein